MKINGDILYCIQTSFWQDNSKSKFLFCKHTLFSQFLIGYGSQAVAEEVEDNIDLIQSKCRFSGFQFTDETNSDSGSISQVLLSHLWRFALLAHKMGYRVYDSICHFYTRSVVIYVIFVKIVPIGDEIKWCWWELFWKGCSYFKIVLFIKIR